MKNGAVAKGNKRKMKAKRNGILLLLIMLAAEALWLYGSLMHGADVFQYLMIAGLVILTLASAYGLFLAGRKEREMPRQIPPEIEQALKQVNYQTFSQEDIKKISRFQWKKLLVIDACLFLFVLWDIGKALFAKHFDEMGDILIVFAFLLIVINITAFLLDFFRRKSLFAKEELHQIPGYLQSVTGGKDGGYAFLSYYNYKKREIVTRYISLTEEEMMIVQKKEGMLVTILAEETANEVKYVRIC